MEAPIELSLRYSVESTRDIIEASAFRRSGDSFWRDSFLYLEVTSESAQEEEFFDNALVFPYK